jgi:cytochrome c oxidase subunit 2
VSTHIDTVLNGRPGTAMQAFANQLTDKEIAAVVTYQRNGLGNSTGDLVQASDVNAMRASESPTSKEGE